MLTLLKTVWEFQCLQNLRAGRGRAEQPLHHLSAAPSTAAQPGTNMEWVLPEKGMIFPAPLPCHRPFASLGLVPEFWNSSREFGFLMLTMSWMQAGWRGNLVPARHWLNMEGLTHLMRDSVCPAPPAQPSPKDQREALSLARNGNCIVGLPGQSIPWEHPGAGGRETQPRVLQQDPPQPPRASLLSLPVPSTSPPWLPDVSQHRGMAAIPLTHDSHCHIRSGARQDKHRRCLARDCSGEERQSRRKRSMRS